MMGGAVDPHNQQENIVGLPREDREAVVGGDEESDFQRGASMELGYVMAYSLHLHPPAVKKQPVPYSHDRGYVAVGVPGYIRLLLLWPCFTLIFDEKPFCVGRNWNKIGSPRHVVDLGSARD
jgi:hypothetical protein